MVSFSFSVAPWRYYLRQEPDAVMPHVRIRAGGRPQGRFLPRQIKLSAVPKVPIGKPEPDKTIITILT